MPTTTTPACAPRTISTRPSSAIAKARAAVINKSAKRQGAARGGAGGRPPRSGLHVQPHPMAAPRRQDRRRPRSGCSRRRASRSSSAIPINGGSSAGWSPASSSISAIPSSPTRSPATPRRRRTRIIAPSSNSPPAGSRCASCTIRRPRSPISPASATASPIRSRSRARYYWQAAPPEALGRGAGRARLLRGGGALADRLLRPARAGAARPRRD